jgi:hypothetical protein
MGRGLDEDGTVCWSFNTDVPVSAQKAIKKVLQKVRGHWDRGFRVLVLVRV